MAKAIGMIGMSSSSPWVQFKDCKTKTNRGNGRVKTCFVSASTTISSDPYEMLRISPDASKSEVKKAFRQLALQYHPDVCKGNNGGVHFHHINEAYDTVMSHLRGESRKPDSDTYESYSYGEETEEPEMEMNSPDLDLWEEWMGWEGAGIRDYSSHINPFL